MGGVAKPENFKKMQQRLWRRGFTCNHHQDPAQKVWAPHVHSVDEIIVRSNGPIEVQHGPRVFRPGEGKELVVKAGVVHAIRNPKKKAVTYLYGFRNRK